MIFTGTEAKNEVVTKNKERDVTRFIFLYRLRRTVFCESDETSTKWFCKFSRIRNDCLFKATYNLSYVRYFLDSNADYKISIKNRLYVIIG